MKTRFAMMKSAMVAALSAAWLTLPAIAVEATSEAPDLSSLNLSLIKPARPEPFYARALDEKLAVVAAQDSFVGLAVAVIDSGDITFLRTYGNTRADRSDPVSEETVFRLASVSKTMASTLVGQLAAEGRLSWTDKAADFSPHFKLRTAGQTRRVTLEDIASHRTGLPSHAYDNLLEAGYSRDTVLDRSAKLKLRCNPGDCYSYQNSAYSLLGDAIEKATGDSFDDAIKERLFDPLGMESASVGLTDIMMRESWARPHVFDKKAQEWRERPMSQSYYRVAAAGGINGSIHDLAQWARAQLGYAADVIPYDLRRELYKPRVDTPQELSKWRFMSERLIDAEYGLGWRIYDYAGERLLFHAGGLSGYRAFVGVLPDRDFAVVALWNTSSGAGWRILPTALDLFLGLPEKDWLGVGSILNTEGEEEGGVDVGETASGG
jgi:beta-lactamase class C